MSGCMVAHSHSLCTIFHRWDNAHADFTNYFDRVKRIYNFATVQTRLFWNYYILHAILLTAACDYSGMIATRYSMVRYKKRLQWGVLTEKTIVDEWVISVISRVSWGWDNRSYYGRLRPARRWMCRNNLLGLNIHMETIYDIKVTVSVKYDKSRYAMGWIHSFRAYSQHARISHTGKWLATRHLILRPKSIFRRHFAIDGCHALGIHDFQMRLIMLPLVDTPHEDHTGLVLWSNEQATRLRSK